MPTVARLNVAPVKSTALHHPSEIRLEPYGAAGNRDLYVIDEDGRLLGGSRFGPLVQIRADHDPRTERLTLAFPDGTVVEGVAANLGRAITTDFYGRPVAAHVVEGPWGRPLSALAGRTVRLARVDRPGDGNDIEPVTIVSLASVDEVSRQGGHTGRLDPARFRMLLEVDGLAVHEEDSWAGRRVRIGDAVVRVGAPVPRCVVTTQDPTTGLRDFPTLSVIKRYRGVTGDHDLVFGMYGTVEEPGVVRVGDAVEPLDGRAHGRADA
jgi:uncharacterized protein YcbX